LIDVYLSYLHIYRRAAKEEAARVAGELAAAQEQLQAQVT
jgi:hypothetical protein